MARVLGYTLYIGAWLLGLPLTEPIARLQAGPVQVRLGGLTLLARVQRWYQLQSQAPEAALGRVASSAEPLRHQLALQAFSAHAYGGYAGFRV